VERDLKGLRAEVTAREEHRTKLLADEQEVTPRVSYPRPTAGWSTAPVRPVVGAVGDVHLH